MEKTMVFLFPFLLVLFWDSLCCCNCFYIWNCSPVPETWCSWKIRMCSLLCGRSWILQRCEGPCYKYKGLGKCVLSGSVGQRIYKVLVTATSQEVISTGTIRLEKPDQQRFQSCHGMRGGEGAPSWTSATLIKEIRNALGKIKIRTGSAGGVHLARGAVPFLSGEGRLRALLTHFLRIFSCRWG